MAYPESAVEDPSNEITVIADGFDTADTATTDRLIGEILKFVKGEWLTGGIKINGTTLVAYDVFRRYEKWYDNKRVAVLEASPGKPLPPSAEDIEDLSEEPGEWSFNSYVYLRDFEDGSDFTFITRSGGGTKAVDTLIRQIRNTRHGRPGAYAQVRLDSRKKDYSRFGYGWVDQPVFTVTGWVTDVGEPYPVAAPVVTLPVPKVQQPEPGYSAARTPVNDLDDDIPY